MDTAKNMVRLRVVIRGTRPLLQHAFTEFAIPLESQERTGVAGNDPEEWKKTCMVTPDGQLYVGGANIFRCLLDGAKYTKKGRGSVQSLVAATMQVERNGLGRVKSLPKGANSALPGRGWDDPRNGQDRHGGGAAPPGMECLGMDRKARYFVSCLSLLMFAVTISSRS
jgi:hypothetical protein